MTEQDKQRHLNALQSAYKLIDSADYKTKTMYQAHDLMNQADQSENPSPYLERIIHMVDQAIQAETEKKKSLDKLGRTISYVEATPAEELTSNLIESQLGI